MVEREYVQLLVVSWSHGLSFHGWHLGVSNPPIGRSHGLEQRGP